MRFQLSELYTQDGHVQQALEILQNPIPSRELQEKYQSINFKDNTLLKKRQRKTNEDIVMSSDEEASVIVEEEFKQSTP